MGGPSSHLKQLKGLVRKAHLTLPLNDPKVEALVLQHANLQVEQFLRNSDMEHVPRCDRPECRKSPEGLWCSVPVAFPPRNWQTVFNARGKTLRELDASAAEKRRVRKFVLPEDVMIYQPGSRKRTQNGLDKLAMAMMDNVLAIDMQWNAPDKKVGILQLASSTFCLLIRGMKYWDRGFPESLVYLFQHPGMITLGFGFDEVDREKLHESFGWSMEEFSNFLDVQALAAKCGYPADSSLSTLTQKILGVKMHVEPSFMETDWEEERLRSSESFFASMSVLAIGQIYRQLRYWHALPKRCSTCRQELGIFYDRHMQCVDKSCNETFKRIDRHLKHCLESGHPYHNQLCSGCHRILPAEEQIKLDASQIKALEIQEVPLAHSVSREVLQNAQNRREAVLKGQYRQSLIACRQDLTHYLYSDLKEVTVH